jgi:hypothetical protein
LSDKLACLPAMHMQPLLAGHAHAATAGPLHSTPVQLQATDCAAQQAASTVCTSIRGHTRAPHRAVHKPCAAPHHHLAAKVRARAVPCPRSHASQKDVPGLYPTRTGSGPHMEHSAGASQRVSGWLLLGGLLHAAQL